MHLLLKNPQSRELLFSELAQLTESAVPMTRVAEIMANRVSSAHRNFGQELRRGLQQNATLPDAMRGSMDAMEHSVIAAADASGQLPEGFRHLSRYYQMLSLTRREILAAIIYPLVVLHLATLVRVLVATGFNVTAMLPGLLSSLALLWLGIGGFLAFCLLCHHLASRSKLVDSILRAIPLSGKARRALALSRWCLAAHFQVLAGRNFGVAFLAGGAAAQSAVLEGFSQRAAALAKSGNEIGNYFVNASEIPDAFGSSIASAEIAGRLDEQLAEWCGRFQTDARFALANLAMWLPKIVFIAAAISVGYVVVSVYTQQWQMAGDLLGEDFLKD